MPEHAFVDASFFVARFNRNDRGHRAARRFLEGMRQPEAAQYRLVFSDYVFNETVTTILLRTGRHAVAAAAGRTIRDSRTLRMVRVEPAVFDSAWPLFLDRGDKDWSFTDCTSFVLMESLDIRKALTFDDNFRQAGFAMLP